MPSGRQKVRRRFPPDNHGRRRWQDPDRVLAAIGLLPGMTFLEVGCGEGYFALPAAGVVGLTGRVCGIDADAGAVGLLRGHARGAGMAWVMARVGSAEETLPGSADEVFFGISLQGCGPFHYLILACPSP